MNELVTINFNGQDLLATKDENDNVLVGMKPICEGIGLDWDGQRQRINRDSVLSSVTVMIKATGQDGKNYEMISLPLEYLNGWLFGIDDKRVKKEIKPALIKYKKECYQTLFNYYHKGVAVNEKVDDIENLLEKALADLREKRHLLEAHKKVIVNQQKHIEEVKPAVESYNNFISSKSNISIEEFAKMSKFPDGKNTFIGKINMFKKLREFKILQDNNLPYQDYMKYFEIKKKQVWKGEAKGYENVSVPLLTPTGAEWLYNRLKTKLSA